MLVLAIQPAEEHLSVVFQRVLEEFPLFSFESAGCSLSNRLRFNLSIVSLAGAMLAIRSCILVSITIALVSFLGLVCLSFFSLVLPGESSCTFLFLPVCFMFSTFIGVIGFFLIDVFFGVVVELEVVVVNMVEVWIVV